MYHDALHFPLPGTFPSMALVRQKLPAPVIHDVETHTRRELAALALHERIRPGQSVAITAGSRGISCLPRVLRACREHLKELGAVPFLVPAMGSHGGGTAQGQVKILESLGITEQSMGVPIRSSMDTVLLGRASCGAEVHVDALAAEADHILVINRVKPHTKFKGPLESGLFKMLCVGLGKAQGAKLLHAMSLKVPFPKLLESVGSVMLDRLPVVAGIGIVENHRGEPALISALAPHMIRTGEEDLLLQAKKLHPCLPVDELDLLIVDEIGKDISGTGMDTNVTGRNRDILGHFADRPRIRRILVLGLSAGTGGNALGIGFADFTTADLVRNMDYTATVLNAMTGISPEKAAIPIHYPDHAQAFAASLASLGNPEPYEVRVARIRNTLQLERLYVSEAVLRTAPHLQVLAPAGQPEFDARGSFCQGFS